VGWAMVLILGLAGMASALPYADVKDTDVYVPWSQSANWFFDLNNDLLTPGDINPGDTILNATLGFAVKDNLDAVWEWFFPEKFDVVVDTVKEFSNISLGTRTLDVLAQVLVDHTLNVQITSKQGDFVVDYVKVSGEYAPVPEPTTLLLLGAGLIGLVALGRKKLLKK